MYKLFFSKILMVTRTLPGSRIIDDNKIDAFLGQVRLDLPHGVSIKGLG